MASIMCLDYLSKSILCDFEYNILIKYFYIVFGCYFPCWIVVCSYTCLNTIFESKVLRHRLSAVIFHIAVTVIVCCYTCLDSS